MKNILHYPRLNTILMTEDAIKNIKEHPTKTQLWKSLPKQVQYQTFNLILTYLQQSNKITIEDNKIIWIFADNTKINNLISQSISTRNQKSQN